MCGDMLLNMMTTRQLMYILTLLWFLRTGTSAICDSQSGKHLDYSHQGITSIPSHLSTDIIVLDISNNNISIVLNRTLQGLSTLIVLDLSNNKIRKLEPLALYGLKQLCFLDLRGNNLSLNYDSFPLPLFAQVPHLLILHIESNVPPGPQNFTYPHRTLQNLGNLRFFYADASPGLELGRGFSSLTSLEEFHSQSGDIFKISNDSLAPLAVTKLKTLKLIYCGIVSIETGAFLHLKHLNVLDLSHNKRLGLEMGLEALYGLQHLNMTDINLSHVNSGVTRLQDSVLDQHKLKYLKNICVANLDLRDNLIVYIDRTFISSLIYPECLLRISLTGNQILSSQDTMIFVFEMIRLRRLEYLDVSGNFNVPPHVEIGKTYSRSDRIITGDVIVHFFPSSLQVLNVSYGTIHYRAMNRRIRIQNLKDLRVLDMSFNTIHTCVSPVDGLENLTVLNFTGFDCSILSPDFLSTYPGLHVLEIKNIRLNIGLESDPDGVFLHHQEKLTSLNMADNGLTYLHPGLFSSLRLLQYLNLGNNKFLELPEALRSMTSLRHLDISFNSLITLNEQDRKWLEQVAQLNKTNNIQRVDFLLSLYGNPFLCTCSTLDFVVWLLTTDIQVELRNNLTCSLANGTRTLIVKLKGSTTDMKVACISRFWLTFALSLASVIVVALCVSVICYRYRHNIKYWFLTKCRRGATYEEVPQDDSQFDAFVAYNHEDYRWTCFTLREFLEDVQGYRLCLHHRDFPVGESIQGNIVDAINSSQKIILVISRTFLACDWGEFEIQMAGMRMVQSGRDNVVIAILLEDIPARQMPRSLLRMWKKITFLLWTNDPGDENIFWGRLQEAMART